jgi:hypothetical protein
MRTLWAILAAAGCACSSSNEPSATPVEDTKEAVVQKWAETDCARWFECFPATKVLRFYGDDVATCVRRRTDAWMRALSSPGAPAKVPTLAKCEARIRSASCEDMRDIELGHDLSTAPECMAVDPGAVEIGQPCAYSAQCKSGLCGAVEGRCGKCVAFAQEGEVCSPEWVSCDPTKSLQCGRSGKCEKLPRRGETCSTVNGCAGWNYCDATRSVCKPWIGERGTGCNPSTNTCDMFGAALVCNNMSNTCEPFEVAAVGDVCGLGVASGGLATCDKGSMCDQRTPGTSNPFSGTCVAAHVGKVGEPCATVGVSLNDPNGTGCEDNLSCVAGVCTAIDPTSCK